VPAGKVTIGGDDRAFQTLPATEVDLPAFRISKFPLTYQQFGAFLDDENGYANPEWWDALHEDALNQQRGGPDEQTFKFLDHPREAVLQLGFSDGLYNRSKGGLTFSGWSCEHLPYFVEFDNYGVSRHPGEANAKGEFNWVWGYDEITWFAHQPAAYRAHWLRYAWDWVRQTDPNGFLEMPGSRTAQSPDTRWYFANHPSATVPTGLGDEDAIRAVWAQDAEQSSPRGVPIK